MTQFINGPINYAYLEGKINGIEKKIYLFMDEHNKLEEQTRCAIFKIFENIFNFLKYNNIILFYIKSINLNVSIFFIWHTNK